MGFIQRLMYEFEEQEVKEAILVYWTLLVHTRLDEAELRARVRLHRLRRRRRRIARAHLQLHEGHVLRHIHAGAWTPGCDSGAAPVGSVDPARVIKDETIERSS